MKCPICTNVNLVMSDRQGIEIDYCPECRGVWLDRGELDKIIERSATQGMPIAQQSQHTPAYQTQQVPYSGHGYSHGHNHGHKPYRKKSFLEELFD